jgi:hypothetical protein
VTVLVDQQQLVLILVYHFGHTPRGRAHLLHRLVLGLGGLARFVLMSRTGAA